MSTPEGKVKAAVRRELESRGFWRAGGPKPVDAIAGWYYMPAANGFGVHGIPDFVCSWLGLFFSIETKAPGGKPTENQKRRHIEIRASGGIVLLVDDVAPVREFLDNYHGAPDGEQAEQGETGVRQGV